MSSNTRNNLYNPVKKMIGKQDKRITNLVDNSKTYNQIDKEVVERIQLTYDQDTGLLVSVEGEDVVMVDLMYDAEGRLESVMDANKVTDRAIQYDLLFDAEDRLEFVVPTVLNEGTPPGFEEEDDDVTDTTPPVTDEEDIELSPPTEGTVGDYDWYTSNTEGERM